MLIILMRKPVRVFLSTRRARFKLRMDDALERRRAAVMQLTELERRLGKLDGEVAALLKEMEVQGMYEREAIIERANDRVRIMHLDAQRQVTHDMVKLRHDMYKRAVKAAVDGAKRVIGERLVGEDASRMVDASIDMVARELAD